MVALVRRELPKATPLVPLNLLRSPSFRVSVLASVCCFMGQTAGLVALPFYLQHQLGQSPLRTGLYMTPWPLMVAIAAPIAGRLANRISTAWLCAVGGTFLAGGLAAASLWPLEHDPLPLVPITALCKYRLRTVSRAQQPQHVSRRSARTQRRRRRARDRSGSTARHPAQC